MLGCISHTFLLVSTGMFSKVATSELFLMLREKAKNNGGEIQKKIARHRVSDLTSKSAHED